MFEKGLVQQFTGSGGGGVTTINGQSGVVALTSTGGTVTITNVGNNINLESAGGSGTPAGTTGNIQYNNAGAFAANAGFNFLNSRIELSSTTGGYVHYNTVDQTTNYERVRAAWISNAYTIGIESAGTGLILDDNRHTHRRSQLLRQLARTGVGASTRGVRHDEGDRLVWITLALRLRRRGCHAQTGHDCDRKPPC